MNIKHIVAGAAALGLLSTILPFASFNVKLADESPVAKAAADAVQQEVEKDGATSKNAWAFKDGSRQPGMVLGIVMVLTALFGVLIGATRVKRGFAIPMFLFAGIGLFLFTMVFSNEGTFREQTVNGVTVSFGPGIGTMLMIAAFVGLLALGLWGTIKPQPLATA